ncbi:uncharacterized protein V6R79_016768 [Siganus canaliculatus]
MIGAGSTNQSISAVPFPDNSGLLFVTQHHLCDVYGDKPEPDFRAAEVRPYEYDPDPRWMTDVHSSHAGNQPVNKRTKTNKCV